MVTPPEAVTVEPPCMLKVPPLMIYVPVLICSDMPFPTEKPLYVPGAGVYGVACHAVKFPDCGAPGVGDGRFLNGSAAEAAPVLGATLVLPPLSFLKPPTTSMTGAVTVAPPVTYMADPALLESTYTPQPTVTEAPLPARKALAALGSRT